MHEQERLILAYLVVLEVRDELVERDGRVVALQAEPWTEQRSLLFLSNDDLMRSFIMCEKLLGGQRAPHVGLHVAAQLSDHVAESLSK